MDTVKFYLLTVKNINLWDIVDILVVSYIFYKSYGLIKKTRAELLFKGVIFILALVPISSVLHLTMLNWILSKTITIGVLSIIIIFQPEIRKALEHLGRRTIKDAYIFSDTKELTSVIDEILEATYNLAKTRTGALIILEQLTGLEDIIATGTKIDGNISASLLENIFVVNTPLHDGATIIRNNKIAAAGCFLPLSTNEDINKSLGTRHRAAIGITENSDALTIVVSEETGGVSLAINGKLRRDYTRDKLKELLVRIIRSKHSSKKLTFGEKVKFWITKIIKD